MRQNTPQRLTSTFLLAHIDPTDTSFILPSGTYPFLSTPTSTILHTFRIILRHLAYVSLCVPSPLQPA
jgi:hypothetical protein